ncbi:MAG: hypothetical protein KDA20_09610 [Phycisphaerales bacterium]|nr:hypothetical protein [Phycisphaerales bacterium]
MHEFLGFLIDVAYLKIGAITAPRWMFKKRSGWDERMGKGAVLPPPPAGKKRLFIHAVSVGEVNLTRPLVERLRDQVDIVVGATTDTGIARARQMYAGMVHVVRTPMDASWMVSAFWKRVKPDAVALVELELWPNMLLKCEKHKVPVCVVNGRLSARSFKNYRKVRWMLGWMFRQLVFAAVQDETYAERFIEMGVAQDRCHVAGTMKWDSAFDAPPLGNAVDQLAKGFGIDRNRPLIVAGSTGPGEAELIVQACKDAGYRGQLLIAPRKPEHFDVAAAAMPGCVRRSTSAVPPAGTDFFLLDTIGELRSAYALADLVIIGRSFIDLHGSDPMEPAALGKAIVMGPRFEDFTSAVEALRRHDAIVQVEASELAGTIGELMSDPTKRKALGQCALVCVEQQRGAADRHATLILNVMGFAHA